MSRLWIALALLWASPWTLLGLTVGIFAVATGGRIQRVGRVLEIYGGVIERVLRRVPIAGGATAMTLGHCVIARTQRDLDRTRRHERVHVAQYERWGPLFLPAYFAFSAWLWCRGRDPYLDNPFEVEAYAMDDCRGGTVV
jgi:hypothetical protein